jgi:hypothetical protein
MVTRVPVGGVSAKLTQFSWGGGGECPDHTASPEGPERTIENTLTMFDERKWSYQVLLKVKKTNKYIVKLQFSLQLNFEEIQFPK